MQLDTGRTVVVIETERKAQSAGSWPGRPLAYGAIHPICGGLSG